MRHLDTASRLMRDGLISADAAATAHFAGVDLYVKLIDRNSDDNLIKF